MKVVLDMELHLTRTESHQTQVNVTCNQTFSHTFDLHTLLPGENGLPDPITDPVTYGKALYSALFPQNSPAQQALASKPKRLLLVAPDDELDVIPWEYAYGLAGWLVCAYPFVRGLPAEQRLPPPTILNGLHVVAVASSPLSHSLAPLDIQGEWTRLTELMGNLDRAVTLERVWPPTIRRLRDLVTEAPQRVVHFMGHGGHNETGEAVLCFERDDGAREDISAREFVVRIHNGGSVFLVTLNACESATPYETPFGNLAQALVREQVPYALGMRFSVYDNDALAFSRDFYSNLARGVPVEEALLQARLTLAKSPHAWACGNLILYTSLTHVAPGYITAPGEPQIRDAQEDALSGIIGVLPQVQGAFQGRIEEQIHLGKWLTGDRRPRIIMLHGSGGQGKTALARVAVERIAHAWPGGVWAMTLETIPTRAIFVASLARFLGINPQDIPEPTDLERQVLLRLRRRRTLLVLDNLETLDEVARAQDTEALSLIEFIRQLPNERTTLLCTSRHLLGWDGEQPLLLPGLEPKEGAALFEQSAPERVKEIEPSLARQLSQRVDGHPLGLTLLGKAFNSSPITLSAFLADHEKYLLSAENPYIGVNHRQRKMLANVAYSVRWLSPELRATLSKLWVFHAPFLPEVAVRALDPEHDEEAPQASPIENNLYTLWQRGLLTREALLVGDETLYLYRLPPVMRPYVEESLADKCEREELLKRFGKAYAVLAIYRALVDGRVIAPLALQCYDDLARAASFVEGIAQGYYLLYWGSILNWLGDRRQDVAVTEQALEKAQGQDRTLEGLALHNLAIMSHATGHPHQALQLYEQSLQIRREVGDRSGEGSTLNNLGHVYSDLGNKQQALDYYQQALVILREVGNRAGEGSTLNNVSRVYDDLGNKQQAFDYLQQALQIRREVGDRAGEGSTLNNLGVVYDDLGDKQQALDYYQQALQIRREVGDRAGEGTTLNNLGLVYSTLGDKQQALDYYQQALQISKEVGNRAGEGLTLHNIGMIYDHFGQFAVALACILLAKALFEYVQSPSDVADEERWIARLRTHLGEEQFASLLIQVEQRPNEIIEQALQEKTLFNEVEPPPSTLPAELITNIVDTIVAVMTDMPQHGAEWRETLVRNLTRAQQGGTDWQIEVEFFTALLAIMDGQAPSLPANHPYAAPIAVILEGIAKGENASDGEEDVSKEA